MSALLRLDGLEAGYGALPAVDGVSLEVGRREAGWLCACSGGRPAPVVRDEPSLGLALMTVKLTFDTLQRVNGDGTTIMLVEQNVPRALQLSHRGYVLENGPIVLEGTRESVRASPHVKQAYLGL